MTHRSGGLRVEIPQTQGTELIANQLAAADELLFQNALAARRRGNIERIGNQGFIANVPNTVGEVKAVGERIAVTGENIRKELTPEERSEAFADKIKRKQDLEASESTSILAALLAGADKTFFTRDVDIPEEIEDEETLGLQTTLAG